MASAARWIVSALILAGLILSGGSCSRLGKPISDSPPGDMTSISVRPALTVDKTIFEATGCSAHPRWTARDCEEVLHDTFTATYTLGPEGLLTGDRIQFLFGYPYNEEWVKTGYVWPLPQTASPLADNYVSASASDGRVRTYAIGARTVVEAIEDVSPGATIQVVFGDTSAGSKGYVVPGLAYDIYFIVEESHQDEEFQTISSLDFPRFRTVVSRLENLKVIAPSTPALRDVPITVQARQGQPRKLENSYIFGGYRGVVSVRAHDGESPVEDRVVFSADDEGVRRLSVPLTRPGVQRVTAVAEQGVSGTSNPVLVGYGGARRLYWGSLHVHTNIGTHGSGTTELAHRHARDVQALDFLAVTEHCRSPSYDSDYGQSVTEAFHAPGSFITFPAYEWNSFFEGHRHVLFKGPHELVYCFDSDDDPQRGVKPIRSLDQLHDRLAEESDALALVHHSLWTYGLITAPKGKGFRWASVLDSPVERLAEIYSWHGSSERRNDPYYRIHDRTDQQWGKEKRASVQDAIAMGYRLGFTADGDNHLGLPGSNIGIRGKVEAAGVYYSRMGLTAVYADELTRESVWDALYRRRTYGTTGARMILDFRDLEGHWMGEEHEITGRPTLLFKAIGTDAIREVTIVRNGHGEVLRLVPGTDRTCFVWTDLSAGPGLNTYYVRTIQDDEHMGWVSPLFLHVPETPSGATPSLGRELVERIREDSPGFLDGCTELVNPNTGRHYELSGAREPNAE